MIGGWKLGSSWELKIDIEKLQQEKKRPQKKIKYHYEAARGRTPRITKRSQRELQNHFSRSWVATRSSQEAPKITERAPKKLPRAFKMSPGDRQNGFRTIVGSKTLILWNSSNVLAKIYVLEARKVSF